MKALLLSLIVALANQAVGASYAPDSIADKVYRYQIYVGGLSSQSSGTIVFHANGTFTTLLHDFTAFLEPEISGITSVGHDGEYTYIKTGGSTAEVELRVGDAVDTQHWEFSSPTQSRSDSVSVFTLTDAAALQTAPALNISTRGTVSPGHPMIVGFVVPGTPPPANDHHPSPHEVLIRVVGPTLEDFGVTDAWEDPEFQLAWPQRPPWPEYPPSDQYRYGDWTTLRYYDLDNKLATRDNPGGAEAFRKLFDYLGAFPLRDGSKDAVNVVSLQPGAYTVIASPGPDDPGGEALVEVYFLP